MDTLTVAERSQRMGRVRSTDTKPELKLRKLIAAMGYRYRLHPSDVPGRPDLCFKGRRRAIFLHGCFWHRHDCKSGVRSPKTRTDFWQSKFAENKRRDVETLARLEAASWRALIVWECQLRDPVTVQARVKAFLDA